MEMNRKEQLKQLLQKINFMAYEVNNYIAKCIVNKNPEEIYANKYEITPNMEVKFYIYNSKTQITAYKTYMFEKLLSICTDEMKMINEFDNAAENLITACDNYTLNSNKIISI